MKPGRELDALVAEKVMGWKSVEHRFEDPFHRWDGIAPEHGSHRFTVPDFSTDIAAAWEVVEKLNDLILERDVTAEGTRYNVVIDGIETWAETAPHAICLAALKAVGHQL